MFQAAVRFGSVRSWGAGDAEKGRVADASSDAACIGGVEAAARARLPEAIACRVGAVEERDRRAVDEGEAAIPGVGAIDRQRKLAPVRQIGAHRVPPAAARIQVGGAMKNTRMGGHVISVEGSINPSASKMW